MADWSHLPKDLLHEISTCFTSIDTLRFRSVCSSWRSSVSQPSLTLPNRIPFDPQTSSTELIDSNYFHLSQRTIYRLTSPNNDSSWLVKIEQDALNFTHLLNPLSDSQIHPLPQSFPRNLDLIDVGIVELGQEFVLRYNEECPFRHTGDVYREKVIFSPNAPWNSGFNEYVIMTIHVSGRLAIYSFKDDKWSVIEDMACPYDDVIHYRGRFFAVDCTGRAVVVCPDLTVEEIASWVFGGDKKCLIESNGDLLLVDRYISIDFDDDNYDFDPEYEIYVPNDEAFISDATVLFKVYKLDWNECTWIELKSLGDRMLFLGDNCAFSASASDFEGCKGNCIYFTDKIFQSNREDEDPFKGSIGVFNMEGGCIGRLASYPGYSELFWPPPAWVTSSPS